MDRTRFVESLIGLVNRTVDRNGQPFDADTAMAPPSGRRRSWAHYGVMAPNLPEPHRSFGVMSIVGTPGVVIFDNDQAITTTPSDTAYTVSATAAMTSGQFFVQSIDNECDLRSDGSHLRFGQDLEIDCKYPEFTVRRHHPEVSVELDITATDKVAHFARIPGLYEHWSLLAHYRGHLDHEGERTDVTGLCTVEYATGAGTHSLAATSGLRLPARFFTYHVLNIDDTTQALLVQVLGPGGFPLQRRVYLRGLDDHGAVYTRGFEFSVTEYELEARVTPDGHTMRLPRRLEWRVCDDAGREVLAISGTCPGDFTYGLGAGFAGSYEYTGSYRGQDISGSAYIEYIDR